MKKRKSKHDKNATFLACQKLLPKKRVFVHHIQPQLQDQAVWMSLSAVFLLFFIAFLSFSDHSSLTGSAVQNIAFVKAGTQLDFGVDEIPGLERYKFQVTETIKNGQMRVEPDETISFARPYYSKFRISSPDKDKIGAVQLFLKLEEQLLLSKGISKRDVRVFRNGEEVGTIFTTEEGRYFYYTATAPGIGNFVIGKAAPRVVVSEQMEEGAEEPTTEVVPVESVPEATPLVGEVIQQPAQVQIGFWERIKAFFGELFG